MDADSPERPALVLNRRKKIVLVRYDSNKPTGHRHFSPQGTRFQGCGTHQHCLDAQPVSPDLKETTHFIRSNTGPLINDQDNAQLAASIRLTGAAKIEQKAHQNTHTTLTLADSLFRPTLVVS